MEQEKQIHTEVVDIDDLIQDDHNFNKGTEAGAELIGRSFKEHGAGRSVFIDKNNRLVGGNKAQKGFKGAGYRKVVIVDSDPDTLVAVRRKDVDLDTKEGREMAMLDNLTTQVNLAWDKAELESISDQVEGFDVGDFGFEIDDLPQVVMPTDKQGEGESKPQTEVKEDDFDPDAKFETKVQRGEVWQLGEHRLMCGDSTSAEDVAKLMNGELADLWLTDPPYNVAIGITDIEDAKRRNRRTDGLVIENDAMSNDDFHKFLVSAFKNAADVMKPGAAFYIWFASREHCNFELSLNEADLRVRQELIWNKNSLIMGRQDYQWKHEPCLYGWKEGAAHNWYSDRCQSTVIDWNKPSKSEDHPTMKPVGLFGYQIQNSSKEGDIILDSFGGSGTTIVACEQIGRKARLMEFEPHYCNVIIARWEKLTGQKAIKLNQ